MTDRRHGAPSRRAGLARRLAFWAAAGVALLVSHDAVFLIQVGPGRALTELLRSGGHAYWPMAASVLLLAAAAVGLWWAARLARLALLATRVAPTTPPLGGRRAGWLRRMLALWPRLFVVVALAFVLQENLEHAAAHRHVLGLGALIGPEHPLALPVLATVTGLLAALVALAGQREATLLRRIARLQAPRAPRVATRPRPARAHRARRDPLALHRAGRAPPPSSPATSPA